MIELREQLESHAIQCIRILSWQNLLARETVWNSGARPHALQIILLRGPRLPLADNYAPINNQWRFADTLIIIIVVIVSVSHRNERLCLVKCLVDPILLHDIQIVHLPLAGLLVATICRLASHLVKGAGAVLLYFIRHMDNR